MPVTPTGRLTLRSSSRAVAFVVAAAALMALTPFIAPAMDQPTEVATSPTVAAPGTDSGAHADGSASLNVDEPVPFDDSDDAPALSDDDVTDDAVSDDAQRQPVVDPRLLSVEATIQRQLVGHGWTVTVDGTIGARTRSAIAEFQHANGLPPTGNLDIESGIRLGSPDANGYQHYLADPLPAPPSSGPAAPRPAADPMVRIEQIADSVGFDWRSRGVTFVIGCHPDHQRCATGSYYPGTRQIFITSRILTDKELLRSVVLHELAHAWQFTVRGWPGAGDDVSAWGRTGIDGLEAAADCLAASWGATRTNYWSCPADAAAHMRFLYENS
jgi:peptidoglycan hydrolase-like protein with peptidoglycan-binding domain